jgi:hypothetical protein
MMVLMEPGDVAVLRLLGRTEHLAKAILNETAESPSDYFDVLDPEYVITLVRIARGQFIVDTNLMWADDGKWDAGNHERLDGTDALRAFTEVNYPDSAGDGDPT